MPAQCQAVQGPRQEGEKGRRRQEATKAPSTFNKSPPSPSPSANLPSLLKKWQKSGNITSACRLLSWPIKPTEKSQQITGNCTLNFAPGKEPSQTECKSSFPPRGPCIRVSLQTLGRADCNRLEWGPEPGKQALTSMISYCLCCFSKKFFLACSLSFCWTVLQAQVPSRKRLAPFFTKCLILV